MLPISTPRQDSCIGHRCVCSICTSATSAAPYTCNGFAVRRGFAVCGVFPFPSGFCTVDNEDCGERRGPKAHPVPVATAMGSTWACSCSCGPVAAIHSPALLRTASRSTRCTVTWAGRMNRAQHRIVTEPHDRPVIGWALPRLGSTCWPSDMFDTDILAMLHDSRRPK